MNKVQQSLTAMSRGLGDNALCSGIHLSLSDVAVGSALGYLDFRFPEVDWRTPHANLHRLYDRLMQRSSFKDTCPS
jgi:glutathione S-transferase